MSAEDARKNIYADIIDLPHHVSERHTPMPMINRAAQFAPFAALTGYGEAIDETARLTEEEIHLSESDIEILNEKLKMLQEAAGEKPAVRITFFEPDSRKRGGAYRVITGCIKKIDSFNKSIITDAGDVIYMDQLIDIETDPDENDTEQ